MGRYIFLKSHHDILFGTYLRSYWDVRRDVVTTSLRRLAAGWFQNIAMLWKSFAGYPVKFLILTVSSIEMFLWTLLKPFFIESKELIVMFWKGLYQCLAAGKKIKICTILLSLHNIIMIIINLFGQVFNVSKCYAQWKIFVIACVFDIMYIVNMLQLFFNCSYRGSVLLPTRIIELCFWLRW